jgi:hypothetical protein
MSRLITRSEYNNIGVLNDCFLVGWGVSPDQLQLWFLPFPCPAPQFLCITSYTCEWINYGICSFLSATMVSIEIVIGMSGH